MPFWATENLLEAHLSDLYYMFPCPLQMGPPLPSLDLPLLLALDPGPVTIPREAETLLQASYPPPDITLCLPPCLPSGLCHPVSGDQPGDQSTVAGSAISDPPPTYPSPTSSPPTYDKFKDGDSPTSLDHLRHILRQHYPNRKPPGRLFKSFISRRVDIFQCTLCKYRIGNREQINQHIMKVHCNHFPFICSFPGW